MKPLAVVLVISALTLLSCILPAAATPTPPPLQGMTPSGCISPEPTQGDIDRALSFAQGAINPAEWERSYSVTENRAAVTWSDAPLGALVYVEALVFPCGYTQPDLDGYFSAQNWKIIFLKYEAYQSTEECRTAGGLRLYQFDAANQGVEYKLRFWARPDTAVRVITVLLVFPAGAETQLDEYSSRLFPDLPVCP